MNAGRAKHERTDWQQNYDAARNLIRYPGLWSQHRLLPSIPRRALVVMPGNPFASPVRLASPSVAPVLPDPDRYRSSKLVIGASVGTQEFEELTVSEPQKTVQVLFTQLGYPIFVGSVVIDELIQRRGFGSRLGLLNQLRLIFPLDPAHQLGPPQHDGDPIC